MTAGLRFPLPRKISTPLARFVHLCGCTDALNGVGILDKPQLLEANISICRKNFKMSENIFNITVENPVDTIPLEEFYEKSKK